MTPPNAKTPGAPASATGVQRQFSNNHQYCTPIGARLEEFRHHIAQAHGLALLGELRADGHFHGLRTDEDRPGRAPFRYCVHLDPPQNIYYQDLKRGVSGVWYPDGPPPTPAECERLRREAEARRRQRQADIQARQASAAARARNLWFSAYPAPPDHPYLRRKGVGAHGLRQLPGWVRRVETAPGRFERIVIEDVLLVPMRDIEGRLHNLQAIFPEDCPALGRDKDFLAGGRKRGLVHWLGAPTETVCLAEGYATAATLHESTGFRAVVAFDASSLPTAAEILRMRLPEARLVVCADNDPAGLAHAEEAARRVGGYLATPPTLGDFNDWVQTLREDRHG